MPAVDSPTKFWISLVCVALTLGACANSSTQRPEKSPADPWEPVNRPIHGFNTVLDTILLKPIAKGYEFILPSFMRRGVTNFSHNLRTPLNVINNLLQGKGGSATNELGRFVANSTFGIVGIFDVAAAAGIPRGEDEDFGQTFAVWGVPDGPYVMVPILGPRTLRDAVSIPLNFLMDPLIYYRNSSIRDKLYGLRLIDVRQRLFKAEKLLSGSQDRYITIREAYLQRRQYMIYDGNPPVDEEFFDEFLEEEDY